MLVFFESFILFPLLSLPFLVVRELAVYCLLSPKWGRALGILSSSMFRLPSPHLHCDLSVPLTAVPGVQSLFVLAFPKRIRYLLGNLSFWGQRGEIEIS